MVWINPLCGGVEEEDECLLDVHHQAEFAVLPGASDPKGNASLLP
jgi:hypothetical protein